MPAVQRKGQRVKHEAGSQQEQQNENENIAVLEKRMNQAEKQIEISRIRANQLHDQWRLHLLRISYLVFLLTLHQFQSPMTSCLYDIKRLNKSLTPMDARTHTIYWHDSVTLILKENVAECLSIIMAAALIVFLYAEQSNPSPLDKGFFRRFPFILATALLFPIIGWTILKNQGKATACLAHSNKHASFHLPADAASPPAKHGFPIVLIYHLIVVGCVVFINMQRSQHEKFAHYVKLAREQMHVKMPEEEKESNKTK